MSGPNDFTDSQKRANSYPFEIFQKISEKEHSQAHSMMPPSPDKYQTKIKKTEKDTTKKGNYKPIITDEDRHKSAPQNMSTPNLTIY